MFEEFATDESSGGHELQLVLVFEETEWFDKRGGEFGEEGAAEFGWQLGAETAKFRDRRVRRVEAGGLCTRLGSEPLHRGDGWWTRDDLNLRPFNFCSSLRS